ncbi:MAG: hypothetical protein LUQ02_05410 [Methanothrix sp.]|nr:hypothetical protein [Methanothrix sp.]OYV11323.1 MAG: hypothetical protein CG445_1093 [Methanosaeta sp. ASM2]
MASGMQIGCLGSTDRLPGIYAVSIVASFNGNAETFADVLEIEVVA